MKLLPKSVEMQKALEADERIVSYDPSKDNLMDLPDKMDWQDAQIVEEEEEVVAEPVKNTPNPSGNAPESGVLHGTITEPQRKKIFAQARDLDWTKEDVEQAVGDKFGKSLKELSKEQASEVIDGLQKTLEAMKGDKNEK